MSQPIVITLDPETSTVRFLVHPETAPLLTAQSVVRRASHVEPASLPLRLAFHALRRVFGETGTVAAFTRAWAVSWRVNLHPSGGPVLPGRWTNRQLAIAAEIEWLNRNFI